MSRKVIFKDGVESTATENTSATFELNVFDMGRSLLRRKRLLFGGSFIVTVLYAAYLLLQPNLFTSTAVILPSGKSTGGMSALTSLVGLSAPMLSSDENSSTLFPVILQSNLIAEAVLSKTYLFTYRGKDMAMSLPEYFDQRDPDKQRKALRDITTVRTNQKTGEIALGVETSYPGFSQAILAEYLRQLEDFNLNKRKSSAKDNASYLATQIVKVNAELKEAEDNLESYQLTNLDWAGSTSPEIQKEMTRLRREVEVKTSTYTMLQQQYEMAKLDAQKDVPIVRLLDSPSLPTQKSGPFRRNMILMTGFMTFFLLAFGILVWDIVQKSLSGKNRNDFDDFTGGMRDAFPRTEKLYKKIVTSRLTRSIVSR
ncbi:MAG: GNVR domain-containing protein [Candidatus Zixiibacteriota bacterium]